MSHIAKIALEKATYAFDKLYDYIIPDEIFSPNLIGCKVFVQFGMGSAKRQGIILEIETCYDEDILSNLKIVETVLDEAPFISYEMIELVKWMKQMYYCTFFDCINTIIPSGLHFKTVYLYSINKIPESIDGETKKIIEYLSKKRKAVKKEKIIKDLGLTSGESLLEKLVKSNVLIKTDSAIRKSKDAKVKMVRIINDLQSIKYSPKQKLVYDFLMEKGSASLKEICYNTGVTKCVIETLVNKNILMYFEDVRFKIKKENLDSSILKKDIVLTFEQETAYESLKQDYKKSSGLVSLLYGITGSGKTSVFMKLIDDVYKEGRGVIVMVPEIALTPQVIKLFEVRFGNDVAVFHSSLSLSKRTEEWKRVKNGDAKIVVGTRSAVFAPFEDVGLIIMDEEQEYTYKSEASPRFHARDIARFRVKYNGGLLILSSATPSIETFTYAKAGRYSLNVLKNRYGKASLPTVTVVDMSEEVRNGNLSMISRKLLNELVKNISEKKQSILLLNRRGYHTFASCKNCGEVVACPRCSISLTFHKSNGRLMCHYCGYSREINDECPSCHSHSVSFSGTGTQKAEQVISEMIPNARILRMDSDTTMSKFSHEESFDKFLNGEFDIMIGTQMVAKGLNFPNVTLVGILSADQSLYSDDFRSYERSFSLFTQVIGRSGRGNFEGKAIIQTNTPENPIIKFASNQDYEKFFDSEINIRKIMLYPPFADIFVIGFSSSNLKKVEEAARFFKNLIKHSIETSYNQIPVRLLGPSPASIEKVNNQYRYKIILKIRNSKIFREMMSTLLLEFYKKKEYNKVNIFFDCNPDIIM